MDRRRVTDSIATKVRRAIDAAGLPLQTIADAADITPAELEDRLSGRVEFEPALLVRVGGVLRFPAPRFLEA